MVDSIKVSVNYINQRIDNFIFRELKNVPKSLIYRLLRKGAIRVNKRRVKPDYKLLLNDEISVPELFKQANGGQGIEITKDKEHKEKAKRELIKKATIDNLISRILYECNDFLIINKPSGMAVHAGSNVAYGVIDILRKYYGPKAYIELVHRLDRDTSGCLLIAKNRIALQDLHVKLQAGEISKNYIALVKGSWSNSKRVLEHPLSRSVLQGGERMVVVDSAMGKPSLTRVEVKAIKNNTSLLQLTAVTGRTHQLRVHCAYEKHPIIGDIKYGDKLFNQEAKQATGLKRIFLHAYTLDFKWEHINSRVSIMAPLDSDLENTLNYFGYI